MRIDQLDLETVRPGSVFDLERIVADARSAGKALYPFGGRTQIDRGLPPTKPGSAVDLRGLDAIIDYPARDMTITVQAGLTVDALQAALAVERQQLPIDVPHADRATIGGAVAVNASGPRRFGHGTLRDYVIGISLVNDLGREVKGGGRVVKNVAGYDLMKLYSGSFGTLGIITQLTFKVKPLPESVKLLIAPCPPTVLETVLNRVLPTTRTRPTVVSVCNRPAAESLGLAAMPCTLLVGFEEKAVTVDWQVNQLNREWPDELEKFSTERSGDTARSLLRRCTDFAAPSTGVSFKANLLPAATAGFFRRADALSPQPSLLAHAGNGIIHGLWPEITLDQANAMLTQLTRDAVEHAGNLVVTHCPSEWKASLPIWGQPTPDRVLMRAVKDKLDPQRLFNPGRFVDGI